MGIEITEGCADKEPDSIVVGESLDHPKPSPLAETRSMSRIRVGNGHLQETTKSFSMKMKAETKEKVSPKSVLKTSSSRKCTVPQPFSLATENRASIRPLEINTDVNKSLPKLKVTQSPNSGKKYQQNMTRKVLKFENRKHSEEEDSSSSAVSDVSSPARVSRSKTVASAPVFKSMERAQKRREFYSKLEEKQQALEAEKLQSEARIKEEIESAIKQLRKSLIFKASPLPSFYHEDPTLKHDGKKGSPTSAKSAQYGRRNSCSNTISLTKKKTKKGNRFSLGIVKKEHYSNTSDSNSGSSITNALTDTTYEYDEQLEPINGKRLSAVN